MVTVLTEKGVIEVHAVYMRKLPTAPVFVELGHPQDTWAVFDAETGERITSAYERASMFFWITTNDIELMTRH